jgi:hypothetical protein
MQMPSAPPMPPALEVQMSGSSSHKYDTAKNKAAPAAQNEARLRVHGPTQNPR